MIFFCVLGGGRMNVRAEAMLQLFNVNWDELILKMPEIAEAGYTSLWLPPPAKAGSVYSVGYDLFDPFDLGDKNQRGTIRTRYGTKAELLQVVEIAHRFGLRVYFDNIMNHRGFDVPGYNAGTPTNLYPGMVPGDFHLKTVGGYFVNWPAVSDYGNVNEIQRQPLFGLIDIANEPGSLNLNIGNTLNSSAPKPALIRQPGNPSYYMDADLPALAGPWRPFNGTNGDPVIEDVNAYLIRAAMWLVAETRCDGFRLDAVKHTPAGFFGSPGATADGYLGGIQTIFDYVHGYGNNVTGNGYVETDDNRNSCFDSETSRNDALLFGEHLGEPPSFSEYLDRGMRLLNTPYHYQFNNIFGNPGATLLGLDTRDYKPYGSAFSGAQSVLFAQSHDDGYANHRELHLAYNFFREGLPAIYSDGYNQSSGPDYFPRVANAPYLGQFGDNKMPELAWLHHQLARGGTRGRWSDADTVVFERYDYREPGSAADQTVVLFAMNDNYGFPGDIAFVDGEGEAFPAGVNDPPAANGTHQGLAVGFPPGSVLVQHAVSAPGQERTYKTVLVRPATHTRSVAAASNGGTVYVGAQSIPTGGGAIEILIPSGGYVAYGYQWPEASRASLRDVITFRQHGVETPRMTVVRTDGVNGDAGFNPKYPFRMRGSIDPDGNLVIGTNVANRTYAIDVPVLTNAAFDILVRADASATDTLLKLDGGVDLNSQLGLGPTNSFDKRDHPPGSATDLYLGYEQALLQNRFGPEKFAAAAVSRNNVTSFGAEEFGYTIGGTDLTELGAGNGTNILTATAAWVYHEPAAANTALSAGTATQRVPLNPVEGQDVDVYVKVGYELSVNRCAIYYTTDGSSPEGSFGVGVGTARTVAAEFLADDNTDGAIDWWKGTIPASNYLTGVQVRYKIGFWREGIDEISDADSSRRFGLYMAGITNFNPATALVWRHANRKTNDTAVGLQEGFHMVRARLFLPRTNKSSVFNTFAQTFYYDAGPPTGVIAFPPTNGSSLNGSSYELVIRTDSSATDVAVNIIDSNPANDDAITGVLRGNGMSNGVPIFAPAARVTPQSGLTAGYPQFPEEYRFTYSAIPSSGTAVITVRVHEATSALHPDRVLTLTRNVNTASPLRVLSLTTPATNGTYQLSGTNVAITIRVCNTIAGAETADLNNYTLRINGVEQPRNQFVFGTSPACGTGFQSLAFRWTNIAAGTNVIEAIFSGSVLLTDTRIIKVVYPVPPNLDSDGDGMTDLNEGRAGTDPNDPNSVLRITELSDGNRSVIWASVLDRIYRVQATTNLAVPFSPVSGPVPASGSTTFYFDSSDATLNKFYRVELVE